MNIKVVMSVKGNVSTYMKDINKTYGITRDFQIMEESDVENYVKAKLQSGHQCAIFSLEQFAYNELIPTFIKP